MFLNLQVCSQHTSVCRVSDFRVGKCCFILVNHCDSELMKLSVALTGQFFLCDCRCGLGWWHLGRSRHPLPEAVFLYSALGELSINMLAFPLLTEHLKLLTSDSTDTPDLPCVCLSVLLLTWPRRVLERGCLESSRFDWLGCLRKASGFSQYIVVQKKWLCLPGTCGRLNVL